MARMFRFLTADEIEVKVKQVKENGLVCLLYKTARTDMDLLDETVGAGNWTNDYKEIKGNLYAGIGIIQENGGIQWKWDCGIESREDEEGNQKKRRGKRRLQACRVPLGYRKRTVYVPVCMDSQQQGGDQGIVLQRKDQVQLLR